MPLEQRRTRHRIADASVRDLDLPPPFRAVRLREVGDAYRHACRHASDLGAGTFVFVGRYDLAEFAVVLEPEQLLKSARLAFYAGMVALADALAAQAPPEKPITIDWPDSLRVDRGLIGGGRLSWPDEAHENAVPDWLVFSASIRTAFIGEEPGLHPLASALGEEGFGDVGSEKLGESFARHLMVAFDRWQQDGFGEVAKEYLAKLKPEKDATRGIDEAGDLLVRRGGKTERLVLKDALRRPRWLDPKTGGPRL